MPNGNTSPYGELFELPEYDEGVYSEPYGHLQHPGIDFSNLSSTDMATIQQSPELQAQYLTSLMETGEYFGEDSKYGTDDSYSSYGLMPMVIEKFLKDGRTLEELSSMNPRQLAYIVDQYAPSNVGLTENAPIGYTQFEEHYAPFVSYLQDFTEGYKKLQGGEAGIGALERELGLLQRDVTGPGGLTQQKGSMTDILGQKIGTSRQEYVPQEKVSRYGQVTGTGGGVDPTSSYLSSVGGDVSAYGKAITGVDKSIYDILYGTDPGSIHDIYGQYGEGVKKSLFDGDELWFT